MILTLVMNSSNDTSKFSHLIVEEMEVTSQTEMVFDRGKTAHKKYMF